MQRVNDYTNIRKTIKVYVVITEMKPRQKEEGESDEKDNSCFTFVSQPLNN